jgi:glucokinase
MMNRISIGADIGGSHITCRLFDLEKNKFVDDRKVRMPVNCHSSKDEILDGWTAAILETAEGYNLEKLQGIGFAMPGPFDYPNGISWIKGVQKFDALYGVNIRLELLNRFNLPDNFPVRFQNDAVCFAIGESFQGRAADYDRLLAITLGTGFGTTFINNHLPVAGNDGVPDDGFLYHIPFGNSIADDHFSTRWFLKEYKKITGKEISEVKTLAEMALTDEVANGIFKTFGQNLGTFLSAWLKTFNAGCLIIGGNISAAYPLFGDELAQVFKNNQLQLEVLISTLQEDAALIGSAGLCDDEFYSKLNK